MKKPSAYDRMFRSAHDMDLFSEEAHLAAMLRVEAALASVQARLRVIPAEAAEAIVSCCVVERIDRAALADAGVAAGNLAIPLVKQLTSSVRAQNPSAASFVHWGATSQDVIDTATVLQLRSHLDGVAKELDAICHALADMTITHRETLMVGRTWLQHAVPVTFGLKTAGWLDAFLRHRERLIQLQPRVLALQFGGAAGTLASLGTQGLEISAALAQELGLTLPAVPWHSHRDRLAEVATFHGLLAGTIGKIARDLSLAMQTEVNELAEPADEGRGGSSTMPQKRNPVSAAILLAASLRLPGLVSTMLSATVQESERGLGGWHAEWETLPQICTLSLGALDKLSTLLPELRVFPEAMQRNLKITNGLLMAESVSMALATHIGRDRAHKLLEEVSREAAESGISLRTALGNDLRITAHLTEGELDALVEPARYLGSASTMIDQVLAAYRDAFSAIGRDK